MIIIYSIWNVVYNIQCQDFYIIYIVNNIQ